MNKQYAIFDMDGTLVDSMGYWKHLAEEYLNLKGICHIPAAILEQIKPMTMTESAALFSCAFELDGSADDIAAEMNALMDAHYCNDIPLKEGVLDYLKRLKDSGINMCVASATAVPLMEVCLTRLGIRDYFSFLLSCEMVGAGKRDPAIYFEAAKMLKAVPEEIAVYEDALYAARTAKEAGFYVIGVFDDSAEENFEELKKVSDEIIRTWQGGNESCS